MPNDKRFIAIRTGNEEQAFRADHIASVFVRYHPEQNKTPDVYLDIVGVTEDIQILDGNVERFLAWYNRQAERLH